jgi:hypothetical protein
LNTTKPRIKRAGVKKKEVTGQRFTLRLTNPLNEIVRRAALYRGDISKTICEALSSVNLAQVQAVDFDESGELEKGTTIVMDAELFARLKEAAKKRGASMNLLINSALAKKFGYSPSEKS